VNANRKFIASLVLGGSVFILSKGILNLFLVPDPPPYGGNSTYRLILTFSYLCVATTLVSHVRAVRFVVWRNWVLATLLLLVFASCLWAESPTFVLQRSAAVLGTSLLGIALAARLSLNEQVRLLSRIFRIMAVLSLVAVFLFPSYGISNSIESLGNWQGIFGYKNLLGAMMAMSILVEWHRHADTGLSKTLKWLAILTSAVLLAGSNSVTSMVALGTSLSFIEAYKFAKQRLRMPLYAIIAVMALIVASGFTVFLVDGHTVTGAFGRTSNLTGRTQIWSLVASSIAKRPVLGYGYSGFWYGGSTESGAVDQAFGEPVMYSHDGYLEVAVSLGIVGLLLSLAFIGIGLKRSHDLYERDRSAINLWPLAFLIFFLCYNIGECTILLQDLQWALCVSVIASADPMLLARETEEEEAEIVFVPIDEPA
jgi:exopolysaccharide production protein ExoQ